MKNQTLKSFFINIVSNLATVFIVPVIPAVLGFVYSASAELKLTFIIISLIIATILLITYFHFSEKPIRLIRIHEQAPVYLVEKGIARHIPDEETFYYLGQLHGFDWKDVEMRTIAEFKNQFPSGSALPSIVPHCQKYCEKIRQVNN